MEQDQHRSPHESPAELIDTDHPAPADGTGRGARKHWNKRWAFVPFVVAAGIGITVAVLPPVVSGAQTAESSTISAVATPPAATKEPAPAGHPAAAPVQSGPIAAQPTGLVFPDAGIDMAVLPLAPSAADLASQTLVPPLTTDAYWLTPYGIPGAGSSNTTYIAGHSWDGKDAPFNQLSDTSLVGTEFTLTTHTGTLTYVVDSVITHDKDTLKDSDIWAIVPNRVVLISCYTQDPWGKNVVVTAMPKST